MRLIDADELLKKEHRGRISVEDVRNAPTVEAQPVRHGRWVQSRGTPSIHTCSCCKVPHNMYRVNDTYVLLEHCPHCTAKMDLN